MSLNRSLVWGLPLVLGLGLAGCKQSAPEGPVKLEVFFTANVGGEVEPCG